MKEVKRVIDNVACSMRSDRGDSAKRSEQKQKNNGYSSTVVLNPGVATTVGKRGRINWL